MKEKLINAVIREKDKIVYINIDEDNKYRGWVSDFNIIFNNKEPMKLDLLKEGDLFLLFVLASSWSKTGPWENAAFFTAYLKNTKKDNYKLWLNNNFIEVEINNRKQSACDTVRVSSGVIPRKSISFRKDYYQSIYVIAKHWEEIKNILEVSNKKNNYYIFIDYISNIKGLGAGKNKMRIKIPLILRELRCQNVYDNIPGELCCVPDERVKVASKELGINIPNVNSIKSLFKASKIIYDNFGDLYDIPLFAYEDLKETLVNKVVEL